MAGPPRPGPCARRSRHRPGHRPAHPARSIASTAARTMRRTCCRFRRRTPAFAKAPADKPRRPRSPNPRFLGDIVDRHRRRPPAGAPARPLVRHRVARSRPSWFPSPSGLRPRRPGGPRPDGARGSPTAPPRRPARRLDCAARAPHPPSGCGEACAAAERSRGGRRHNRAAARAAARPGNDSGPAAAARRGRRLRRHDRDGLQHADAAVAPADGRARRPRRSPRLSTSTIRSGCSCRPG